MANTEMAIMLPFNLDSFGKVAVANTQEQIWADRVLSVVGTAIRERIMRPKFGTLIPFFLFDTDDSASSEIEDEIRKVFANQLSLLTLQTVNITVDSFTNVLELALTYLIPNNKVLNTNIGYVLVDGNNPIYQEFA